MELFPLHLLKKFPKPSWLIIKNNNNKNNNCIKFYHNNNEIE